MATSPSAAARWNIIRPDPPGTQNQYFRQDLRRIAGRQPDQNLPWQDDLYLSYPSPEAPSWPEFVAHVKALNQAADQNTQYKIVYVMRRAHKERGANSDTFDPALDEQGRKQCLTLAAQLKRAMRTAHLPPPEIIMTSPLARALETTYLGIRPLFPAIRPVVLENLREIMTGSDRNQRHSRDWIEKNYTGFDVELEQDDALGKLYYSGSDSKEPYEVVWQRVQGVFDYVFERYPNSLVILLMSHCGVEQTIQREITGWDLPESERREAVEFYVGEAGGYAIIVKGTRRNSKET